jgi:hypothetical protein
MATTIKLKNSVTTTNAPSSLVQGEVAINITDKKVWVGNAATTPIQLLGDGGSASFTSIAFGAGTVSSPSITFTGDTNTGIYSPAADTIAFTEGGVESMRIDSSSRLLLGMTSNETQRTGTTSWTGTKLQVRTVGSGGQSISQYSSGFPAYLWLSRSNSDSSGTQTAVTSGQQVGGIVFSGSDGTNFTNTAEISSSVDGTPATNDMPGRLVFSTTSSGSATPTERMRITSTGNVGIGTTSPSYLLDVNGTTQANIFRIKSAGYITDGGGNVTFNPASGGSLSITSSGSFTNGNIVYNALAATGIHVWQSNNTERMRIDSSGNVGIGNTPTYSRLDIVDVKAGANFSGLTVWNNTTNATGVSSTINLPVFNGSAGGVIQEIGNSVDGYRLNIYQDQGSGVITFGTGGNNERMRITSTGTVGIGTSTITSGAGWTPTLVLNATSAALVVKGVNGQENSFGTSNGLYIDCLGNSTGTNNNIIFRNTSSNSSFSSTERMRIDSSGNVGIGTSSPSGRLDVRTAALTSATVARFSRSDAAVSADIYYDGSDGCMSFGTTTNHPIAFDTNNTERMRITSGGEVYIAGTTDQGAYNLQCNGTGVWGAGAYVNGSDERIKDDITPLDSGLDVVAKLNPVTYKYKEDWSKDQSIQTGFIAQELLTALEGKNYVDGVVQQGGQYMSVAYQNIIPILTKAIQELKAQLDESNLILTSVKTELDATKAEVALLKSK